MKKILFISSVLMASLLADDSLGTAVTSSTIDNVIAKQSITKESIEKQIHHKPYARKYTKTVVPSSSHITDKHTFKKDHHRYDKRFLNFDYDNNAYYNDDGYYYGYYDTTGYFYNNIFFTYNTLYTYRDRCYRRGYFTPRQHHYRTYRYHRVNDWNRVHCYREPNQMVYGHYYDRRDYSNGYRENYRNDYRDSARMTLPRRNYNINQSHSQSRIINHHYNTSSNHNHREYDNRNYYNRNHNNSSSHRNAHTRGHPRRNHSIGTRMTIHRSSSIRSHSPKQEHSSHTSYMQMSR